MFDHLKRYGVRGRRDEVAWVEVVGDGAVSWKGKRWDLRSGTPAGRAPGFGYGPDGRHLAYGEGGVCAVHPDGRIVPLASSAGMFTQLVFHVGGALVFSVSGHAAPWAVVDTETGELRGRLEGQRKDEALNMYYPAVFDPRDGRHLWLAEGPMIRAFDVTSMSWATEVPMPSGRKAVTCAVSPEGNVAAFLRPVGVTNDSREDVLVLLDPEGRELARVADLGVSMGIARVGAHFVVTECEARRFRVFDTRLRDVESVAMMPDDDWASVEVLPSGREWLAIGGFGQWDHYGELGLGPVGASRVIEAATRGKKTAAASKAPSAASPAKKKAAKKESK